MYPLINSFFHSTFHLPHHVLYSLFNLRQLRLQLIDLDLLLFLLLQYYRYVLLYFLRRLNLFNLIVNVLSDLDKPVLEEVYLYT